MTLFTKEEFLSNYLGKSGISADQAKELGLLAIPCRCPEPSCCGWKMVSRDGEPDRCSICEAWAKDGVFEASPMGAYIVTVCPDCKPLVE